jgi:hypothetical protein
VFACKDLSLSSWRALDAVFPVYNRLIDHSRDIRESRLEFWSAKPAKDRFTRKPSPRPVEQESAGLRGSAIGGRHEVALVPAL